MLCTILDSIDDFNSVFGMEHFLPLMDRLPNTQRHVVSKGILTVFSRQQSSESDPVTISTMFDMARTIHDALSELASASKKQETTDLIVKFLQKVDFGKDFEQQLNFFTECRGAFCNLDTVIVMLVHKVLCLITQTLNLITGKHTKKTSNFVKVTIYIIVYFVIN